MKDVKSWVQESHSLSKMITKYIHIQTSSFQMLKSKIKSLRQPEKGEKDVLHQVNNSKNDH